MPEIQRVSHRHDAIIDWLIAHPTGTLGECAAAFEVTRPWLSCIIHSDAFRAAYEERRTECSSPVVRQITEKLHAVANEAIDRLHEDITEGKVNDPRVLCDVSDKVLGRLGYGVQKGGPGGGAQVNVQNNNYYTQPVDRDALAKARSRMHQRFADDAAEEAQGTDPVPEAPAPAVLERQSDPELEEILNGSQSTSTVSEWEDS